MWRESPSEQLHTNTQSGSGTPGTTVALGRAVLWLLFSYIFSSASTLSQEQDSTLGLTEPFQMQCGCSLATARSPEVNFSTLHTLLQAVPLGFGRPNQSKLHKI